MPEHTDDRGTLHAIDEELLPFVPRRVFYLEHVPTGKSRAGHAVDAELFIMALKGHATILADKEEVIMESNTRTGYYIPAYTFIKLSLFSDDALIAICASKAYSQTRYFSKDEIPAQ